MSQITITDETILVRDGTGKVQCYLAPIHPADLEPRISEEELRRRENDTTCKLYTTEELIAKLRAR